MNRREQFSDDANAPPAKPQRDPSLCRAQGCPMRGSVDMGHGRLCAWHDQAADTPHEWPRITAELVDIARRGGTALLPRRSDRERKPGLPHPPGPFDPLHWARSLRERERQGERLSLVQREGWRNALRHENPTKD